MSDLIVVTPDTKAAAIFSDNNLKTILGRIEEEVLKFEPDLKTATSRKEIASIAHKVSRSKTFIDDKGKELTEDWRKKVGEINEHRKEAKEFLDNLKVKVRAPLTKFEEDEKIRVATYRNKIQLIESWGDRLFNLTLNSEEVSKNISNIESEVIDESWQEFQEEALTTRENALEMAKQCLQDVIKKEQEAEELAQLRKEADERKRKDHEDMIAKNAAEKAKKEAEEKAASEAKKLQEEKDKLEQEKIESEKRAREFEARKIQEAKDAEEKAEKEKLAAVEAEKEKFRIAELEKAKQAEIARAKEEKRVANQEHRKSIETDVIQSLSDCINDMIEGDSTADDIAAHIVSEVSNNNVYKMTIQY